MFQRRPSSRHRSGRWLALAAGAALAASAWLSPTPAPAAGRATPPAKFQWDRFAPKGAGISLLKPTSMKFAPRKAPPKGYTAYVGREPQTGTRLTLYVSTTPKTQAALERDLYRLTGQPAKAWLPLVQRGPTQGFAWQRGLYRQTPTQQTQSALLMAHARRPQAYIVIVEVDLTVASRYLQMFNKAYLGMRAVP